MNKSISMILAIVFIAALCITMTAEEKKVPANCTLANGQVTVNNPLANWQFNKYAGENQCTLEKQDSPENPLYLSPRIDVVYSTRKQIQVSAEAWAQDHAEHTIDALNPKVTDAKLGGKAVKKLTYKKVEKTFDKKESFDVLYQEYFVVEKDYALNITVVCLKTEVEAVGKQADEILAKIQLK
ncbi:MAG: hypothetical protein A2Y62_16445 [Candidatus Fischerbacteria bacterium RBG_13_37_8]|uniref:PsbP C-terminal domain-containing protein n=1 Tax=Candidatus Fischerbacteria bacterium RBG_13_37_8 TaxID=1817863 RepID=A0A1F5VKR0_9BACT|nr:MAG: hypothetical protein A2Y62_16445 [Candidatus Fischerbacteria bacterium RBG_13_37_8]